MESLVLEVSNPDTVHAIAEAAKRQGTTPEAAALELLETAVLAQKPFAEIVEPVAKSFDESDVIAPGFRSQIISVSMLSFALILRLSWNLLYLMTALPDWLLGSRAKRGPDDHVKN